MKLMFAVVSMGLCLACSAQGTATAAAPRPELPSAGVVPQRGGEPQVKRMVSEDESVRIEELRVRGITRRVTVQPKLPGVPAYEIGSASDGRDLTQDRRSEGRSLWQLFSF